MSDLLLRMLSAEDLACPVISPRLADYNRYRKVWNGVADKKPQAIVRAQTLEDVQRAVSIAAQSGSLLAIRGGGHSLPGFSTCDDGLVLDLSRMNAVSMDLDALTVDVGGGALLGDLDRATVPQGFVVPAGVISHTGVGGLTLGGGMGWLSRRYGLTIDSLLGVEIVLADGTATWADELSDPELFWGLRGGGGNFGVATRFRFKLHRHGNIVAGQWNYPLAQARTALTKLGTLLPSLPHDFTMAFTATATGISLTAIWLGPREQALSMLQPFGDLAAGAIGGVENLPYLTLQSRNDAHYAWSRRYYAKGGYWADLGDEAIEQIATAIAEAPGADCEIYVIQLGGAIAERDDEATAYTGRAAAYYWLAEPVWDSPADDEACIAWGRRTAARLASPAIAGNYVNEQGDSSTNVAFDAYGVKKYRRLARLKKRIDPTNLFRLNQNIKPED